MDCIFCDIINKKSSAEILYEDEKIISFLDINPINYGHTLVIPKNHFDNFLTIPDDELSYLSKMTQFIAGVVKRSMKADGFNIISNNGESAGQSVFHFHYHIIPRFSNDFTIKLKFKEYHEGGMKEYGNMIRTFINKYRELLDG